MRQQIDVPVPMRDGVTLSADIRCPDRGGAFPVVLTRTPYGNSGLSGLESGLLGGGYAVVKQDCRGRFDSGGRFNPLHEDTDGADTLAWIRAQPWCNGRLGMLGGSYNAYTQYSAAWTQPPGLCALTTAVMGDDPFKELVYYNGVFNLSLAIGWGSAVSGRTGQGNDTTDWTTVFRHLPLLTMDEAAGYRLDYFREWLSHPLYDDYWAAASVERHQALFDLPVLHAGGWYDIYAAGVIRNFCGIRSHGGPLARAHQKLLVGPWAHGLNTRVTGQVDFGDQAIIPLDSLYRRWLDRWVRGDNNGIDREAPIRLFIMGENVWRDEEEWPLARAQEWVLHLDSGGAANSLFGDGVLRPDGATGAERDAFLYDPMNPVPAVGGNSLLGSPSGPTDHSPVERRDDVLVYTGPVLTEAVEVTGEVRLLLYVASDAVDTDFVARLCDVYPDGRSMVLCDGITRTRFREGLDRECFMTPGTVCELAIDVGVTANLFLPGHRLRLEVTSSCFPRFARNLNTGEPAATSTRWQVAHQAVCHSRRWPSRLCLPVIPR